MVDRMHHGCGGHRLRGTWPVLPRPGGGEAARSISRPLFSVRAGTGGIEFEGPERRALRALAHITSTIQS